MASYLRPRRGAYSAISSQTLLNGEIFFETPNGVGGGKGRIMLGNGVNSYSQLAENSKYFLDIDSTPVEYTNITGSSGSTAAHFSTLATSLGSGTVTLPKLVQVLKKTLYDLQATFNTKANKKWTEYNFGENIIGNGSELTVSHIFRSFNEINVVTGTGTIVAGGAMKPSIVTIFPIINQNIYFPLTLTSGSYNVYAHIYATKDEDEYSTVTFKITVFESGHRVDGNIYIKIYAR